MLTRLVLFLALFTTGLISAQPKVDRSKSMIEIPFESDRLYVQKYSGTEEEIRVLKMRIKTLESATRQLQEEIYAIKYGYGTKPNYPSSKPSSWYCSVKSSFSNFYSGRGTTQLEARDTAMNACQKEDSIHCPLDKVACEKEV